MIGTTIADIGPETRIALVRDKTQFAQSTLQMAATALSARGRTPVLVETFAGGDKDFAALAQRVKAAGVTHIALAAFPSEASLLVIEVRKLSPDVTILATDTLADPAFARSAGLAANGIQVALAPDARVFSGAQTIVAILSASRVLPRRPALASAAAVELVSAALTRAPSSDLARTITTQTFQTILGSIAFDPNGVANLPAQVLYMWSNGVLRPPAR